MQLIFLFFAWVPGNMKGLKPAFPAPCRISDNTLLHLYAYRIFHDMRELLIRSLFQVFAGPDLSKNFLPMNSAIYWYQEIQKSFRRFQSYFVFYFLSETISGAIFHTHHTLVAERISAVHR